MAAAKGMLPLSNEELLEVLVVLSGDEEEGVRAAAGSTIDTLKPESFITLASDTKANPDVLGFLCVWPRSPREIVEAAIFNRSTPDKALAHVAGHTKEPSIVEAIALNQQALIRLPDIIEAIG